MLLTAEPNDPTACFSVHGVELAVQLGQVINGRQITEGWQPRRGKQDLNAATAARIAAAQDNPAEMHRVSLFKKKGALGSALMWSYRAMSAGRLSRAEDQGSCPGKFC